MKNFLVIALITLTAMHLNAKEKKDRKLAGIGSFNSAIGCGIAVSPTEFIAEYRMYLEDTQLAKNPSINAGIEGTLIFRLKDVKDGNYLKDGARYCIRGNYSIPADGSNGTVESYTIFNQ